MDWRVCNIKCKHICGLKIKENHQDFSRTTSSFYRPCSVHLISLINTSANEYLNSKIRYKNIFNICLDAINHLMHYFNNVLNKIVMLWNFLELTCSYPCLHGSTPSVYNIDWFIFLLLNNWQEYLYLFTYRKIGKHHIVQYLSGCLFEFVYLLFYITVDNISVIYMYM